MERPPSLPSLQLPGCEVRADGGAGRMALFSRCRTLSVLDGPSVYSIHTRRPVRSTLLIHTYVLTWPSAQVWISP